MRISDWSSDVCSSDLDLADVRGQAQARRALEVAAAGNHHLLLVGPPGCGKTLLASRLTGLLPQASEAEALQSAAIASVRGSGAGGRGLDPARWQIGRASCRERVGQYV